MASEHAPKIVVSCAFCRTLNAANPVRVHDQPKCGSCGRPLLLDRPVAAHDADLERTLNGSTIPVVVDFYADWCGPCKIMAPIFDDLAARYTGRVLFLKVDSDRNPAAAQRHVVRALPTLVIFEGGREIARQMGAVPAPQLQSMLEAALGTAGRGSASA